MVDLVKAVNFPPVQRWIKSLASVSEHGKLGVVLMSIEICSVKYDSEDANLVVEVRLRPVLYDVDKKRLRLSSIGDETIILKEYTTRLILIVERPGTTEVERQPMVILERSAQMTCAGENHMQHRLPTVQVSMEGEIEGAFARAIQPALRVTLNRHTTTKQLLRPIHSNPMLGNAAEDVIMYVQEWHPDAHAKLNEKLEVASRVPPEPEEKDKKPKDAKPLEQAVAAEAAPVVPATEGCSYVAVPLEKVAGVSNEALTVIAATAVLQRRKKSELPLATAPKQRPPTPLPPAPEPRPELQPLYDARAALKRAEEGSDNEDDDDDEDTAGAEE
ncbi:hypothetical protein TcCL_ESM10385 [Trypanosoma cruzi]|nr:hypothetical protein TcCL_ESM10385 [Trypanosoma cruzi]